MSVTFMEDGYLCDWTDVPFGAAGIQRVKRDGRHVRLMLTPVSATDRYYGRRDFGDESITHRAMMRNDRGLNVGRMRLLFVDARGFREPSWFKIVGVQVSLCTRYVELLLSEIEARPDAGQKPPETSEKYGY